MNAEGDEECTADYGVFGDNACTCSACNRSIEKPNPRRQDEARIYQARREREREVSASFNRYMIDLYNGRRQ